MDLFPGLVWVCSETSCYHFAVDATADAVTAEQMCADLGGRLLSIESSEEQQFMAYVFSNVPGMTMQLYNFVNFHQGFLYGTLSTNGC